MQATLFDYQKEAVKHMHNGCILCGGVGSGKTFTSLAYYFTKQGGDIDHLESYMNKPKNLYIITTAKKRDDCSWEKELSWFLLNPDKSINHYNNEVIIDSWNNISKYTNIQEAFFIFDEQRAIGSGTWSKSLIKIAKKNEWILLSATPGDTWLDYIPVFIANGFYKNRTEFLMEHVVYKVGPKFPVVDRYVGIGKLIKNRERVLVNMDYTKQNIPHHIDIPVNYDKDKYKCIVKTQWDIYKDIPIKNASQYCACLRHIVYGDQSRAKALLEIFEDNNRIIVFYQYNYELNLIKNLYYGDDVDIAEWNGHKHEDIPTGNRWVYIVQYTAGAEGWNCVTTDTVVFFSQSPSYKLMAQSMGRIDRLNSPFKDLYYYHLKSTAPIDLAMGRCLKNKKKFNESAWVKKQNITFD